ncbi:TetR/AcrR family transcriptional regulator [Nocardioides sp. InS609-2]|uniref:TetR/AcrR family transcriptional regulator n=1 Tax=Nocardioides sp. InS609-2 TaxID=2760705 RepID=UPI0017FED8A5|nr:TetR/AcrR family transcriptional regulator [Nocardioides sp. InS609-2]MBA3782192.1 TetR/AcrR family transcriptional regulator [Nocardioides sp.]
MTTPTRTRLSPDARRAQLLDLGVGLLATRSLDELSIDLLAETAGISRGLLYHYFGGKQEFREAVVRRAVDDLIARTAPPEGGDPMERLLASMTAYVDYVETNHAGYVSIVKGAAGGAGGLSALYEEARSALTDRIFSEDAQGELVPDTPAARLMVRGWSALAEEVVLTWVAEPGGVTREELLQALTLSLPQLVALVV